jgi:hypothetical protein
MPNLEYKREAVRATRGGVIVLRRQDEPMRVL